MEREPGTGVAGAAMVRDLVDVEGAHLRKPRTGHPRAFHLEREADYLERAGLKRRPYNYDTGPFPTFLESL